MGVDELFPKMVNSNDIIIDFQKSGLQYEKEFAKVIYFLRSLGIGGNICYKLAFRDLSGDHTGGGGDR